MRCIRTAWVLVWAAAAVGLAAPSRAWAAPPTTPADVVPAGAEVPVATADLPRLTLRAPLGHPAALPSADAPEGADAQGADAGSPPTLPPVVVRGRRAAAPTGPWRPLSQATSEHDRVGPYGQPEWTTQRRFTTTRAYVLAPWQVELETWWKGKIRHGVRPDHLFQEEIGIGLPCRFQLDLYGNWANPSDGDLHYATTQVEVRYALADWNCLPLNPTLYGEWKFNTRDDPDAWEVKLLLAQEFGPCWRGAVNLFYEREVAGQEAIEMGVSAATAWTVIDRRLSLGVEAQIERATEKGSRGDPSVEVLLGPSVQVRFGHNTHLDVVPLLGLTSDAPDLEMYVNFGIDIGPASSGHGTYVPTATRSR